MGSLHPVYPLVRAGQQRSVSSLDWDRRFDPTFGWMHYVVVNGRVIYEDGRLTGELPGQVLRGAAYTVSKAAAA